mgnify:CR=1 FL=1
MNVPGEPIAKVKAGQLSKISFLLDKKTLLEGPVDQGLPIAAILNQDRAPVRILWAE